MAGLKLEGFSGLAPRYSERLLPPMAAVTAQNTKLLNGEIRGYRDLFEKDDLTGLASTIRRVMRVPDTPNDAYIAFNSRDVSIVKSPLINDGFDRYFWAGDGQPKMNTGDRIKNGDPEFLLGVPAPTVAPTLLPPVGADETRAYVYTFETAYGEEGPPSPPTVATGGAGVPWDLSGIQTVVPDASQRNVTLKNIYRTVPGNFTTSFFFVAQIPVAQATYADNETNEDVAASNLLESTTWVEPPSDMEGFVVMPNGFLVGWVGTRLLFSEPYRPHAWPAAYELATEFPIVSCGVFGSTLVIGTESQPYFGQGVSPASFTTMKIDAVEPCLSRRGMVSTTGGVYYPSINGLVAATGSGVMVITRDILTKEEWALFGPDTLYAAQLGLQYIAFSDSNTGFIYDPQEPMNKLITLDGFTDVEGIETDPYTGNVYLLTNDRYAEWDPEGTTRLTWRWKGKMMQTPKPVNFGAVRIMAEMGGASQAFPVETILRPYNEALFTAINALPVGNQRLNTLNGAPLGGSPAQQSGLVTAPEAETRQPLGGSLLYNLNYLAMVASSIRFIAYIRRDQVTKAVIDTVVTSEKVIRMPTGFKSDLWQFEMVGNTTVYSVQIAETPNQLAGV